jgi:hypothetical protein
MEGAPRRVRTLMADDADAIERELRQTRARLAELRRAQKKAKDRAASAPDPDRADFLYGADSISAFLGCSRHAVYYGLAHGIFGDGVWKAGPRSIMGSKSRLLNLGKKA